MSACKLTNRRLMAVANLVRHNAVVADIGTDHAYLPVFLIEKGVAVRAYATDINQGPLDRAKANIADAGLTSKIETRLANGLDTLDESLGITDITVCGMGGELISSIIAAAPWVKSSAVRLILQPMTKADVLRENLLSSGFDIVDEALVEDDRIYQIICAEYCPKVEHYTAAELLLGKHNIKRNDALFGKFAKQNLDTLEFRRQAKHSSGHATELEDKLIKEIKAIKKSNNL